MKRFGRSVASWITTLAILAAVALFGARGDWRRIDDFLLAFWDALVGRWAWLRIAAIVVGLAWAVLASDAAQRAWKEDGAWSPRVFGLVLSTAAGVFVGTSGLALWIVYART